MWRLRTALDVVSPSGPDGFEFLGRDVELESPAAFLRQHRVERNVGRGEGLLSRLVPVRTCGIQPQTDLVFNRLHTNWMTERAKLEPLAARHGCSSVS